MYKFLKGFSYAWKGVLYTFRTQINFSVQLVVAIGVLLLCWCLQLDSLEWLWILASITLVLICEMLNTAVETLVNLVSPEYNPRAGVVKDIFAAIVLVAACFALICGGLIILPKLADVI